MHPSELEWVLARAPRFRTEFPYFKDRYAWLLLDWAGAAGGSVRSLRQGRFASLLDKPSVKRALGRGPLAEPRDVPGTQRYQLGFGTWGESDERKWYPAGTQTTRPGLNLVVHLAFPKDHRRAYFGLVAPELGEEHPWVTPGHPSLPHLVTLAWARVDVAFDSSEALIEEVQSDWVRAATAEAKALSALDEKALLVEDLWGFAPEVGVYHVLSYVEQVLAPHLELWAEATLAAALFVVRQELGIRRVFYNTWETGAFLKDQEWGKPPRSLYTDLPRRFCFRRTHERPRALSRSRSRLVREKLARKGLEWFLLEL